MRIGKIGVVIIGLVPFNVYGECTPTPDCASIGYTETSCSGSFVRCPFDTSKLFCAPCDSIYKYDCSGDNITGGTGSACGGKYVSCECSEGSVFKDGACACDDSCTIGAIYYSDGTCSSCVNNTKTAIGIVVKDNELVISKKKSAMMTWSNTFSDTSLTNYSNNTDAKTDFNGKSNTAVIVAAHPTETVDNNAAIYCNSYSTEGTNAGDWYLPAAGELYSYVYENNSILQRTMSKLNWGAEYWFWTSSESSGMGAWEVQFYNGSLYVGNNKREGHNVSCFLAID